jgi:ABC-type branched-subunit amino acid transport system substrate-binding protein
LGTSKCSPNSGLARTAREKQAWNFNLPIGKYSMTRQNKVWLILASITWLLPVSAQAQVKIGVAAPISGPSAEFGLQIRMGVGQAIEDINARRCAWRQAHHVDP